MNTTMTKQDRHRSLREKSKLRTILLNTLAEFLAVIIFSGLYFIFIARYLSEAFSMDYIALCFSIGLVFFAAIYIPFHTYRIHVLPFISLISALRKRDISILLYKLPAQVLGSFIGVLFFSTLNANSTQVSIEDFQQIHLKDANLAILINTITAVVLCYGYYLIRILFQAKQMAGTIYLSLFFAVVFALTSLFSTVSALNPFGYLFYDMLGNQTIKSYDVLFLLINHVFAPVVGVFLLFFYIQPKVFVLNKKA
jgi:hypothetical protein